MFNSSLFDETTFCDRFTKDLLRAEHKVVIESPFITLEPINTLIPTIGKLLSRDVRIYAITRDPVEHQESYKDKSEKVIQYFERIGI